ncbi:MULTISPECIES: hypothetical protein [unclassified Cupriavidus]|uniref:hypothetical protein n=1 Tax=unclassified Cupriavidus TaxID=2640874 RepID=UPI003F90DA95
MFEYNESLEQALHRNVEDALREDIERTDWTAQFVAVELTKDVRAIDLSMRFDA